MELKERKMLLVVDPQLDFINGTLPVPGAAEAMDALADYVEAHGEEYEAKIVTSDWHPYRHSSFAPQGGSWPIHCVQHSPGAAVWPRLLQMLNTTRGGFTMLYKGDLVNRDEYSIMQNAQSKDVLMRLVPALKIDKIDVCGLAGNVCVLNTAKDLVEIFGPNLVHVLPEYSPSLDDGSQLQQFISEAGLK